MSKLSVIIPSAGERFLPETLAGVYDNARGDVEAIVVLDGYWPDPPLQDYPGLKVIHNKTQNGLRAGINAAAAVATGKYLMKIDAHVLFAEGYDEVLKADCEPNWVAVPVSYTHLTLPTILLV